MANMKQLSWKLAESGRAAVVIFALSFYALFYLGTCVIHQGPSHCGHWLTIYATDRKSEMRKNIRNLNTVCV